MFFRMFGYNLLRTVRQKQLMFWSLLFPIILGTLFKISFGGFTDNQLMFKQIPVAYVTGEEAQEEFGVLLDTLEEDSGLVKVIKTNEKEAKKLLKEEKAEGIFFNDKEVSLTVTDEGVTQSILKSILEQYVRTASTLTNIAQTNPSGIEKAVQALKVQQAYIQTNSVSDKKLDYMVNYFYALLAMTCLYGSFMGLTCAMEYKADLSTLGARRNVAATNRFWLLTADVAAKIITQLLCTVAAMCYLMYFLKVNLGSQIGLMLLIVLAGSTIGVSMGVLIGSVGKAKESVKDGICVGISMILSFLAGLMVDGMYWLVETNAPIINRINPASLMVNAFYSLNIYDNYEKYVQCIASMFLIAALLCVLSFVVVRRERYASI